ncbi:749_t:CDS:1, partial [Acaulospora morrowiae]
MKFGKYIQERMHLLPEDWKNNCIDYIGLKADIKANITPNNLKLELSQIAWRPQNEDQVDFIQLVFGRMGSLQVKSKEFLVKLDSEVQKVSDFFVAQTSSLVTLYKKNESNYANEHDLANLLQSIVKLEKFVFLNYTGL